MPFASAVKITTNNVPRDVINAWELSAAERAEFDYLDWQAIDNGEDSAEFFRYRGELYDIGEFSRIIPPGSKSCHPMECDSPDFVGWCGYTSDSYFSGMLVKYVDNGERVIVARYCS